MTDCLGKVKSSPPTSPATALRAFEEVVRRTPESLLRWRDDFFQHLVESYESEGYDHVEVVSSRGGEGEVVARVHRVARLAPETPLTVRGRVVYTGALEWEAWEEYFFGPSAVATSCKRWSLNPEAHGTRVREEVMWWNHNLRVSRRVLAKADLITLSQAEHAFRKVMDALRRP